MAKIPYRITQREAASNLLCKNFSRFQCDFRITRDQKLLQKESAVRPEAADQPQKADEKPGRKEKPS